MTENGGRGMDTALHTMLTHENGSMGKAKEYLETEIARFKTGQTISGEEKTAIIERIRGYIREHELNVQNCLGSGKDDERRNFYNIIHELTKLGLYNAAPIEQDGNRMTDLELYSIEECTYDLLQSAQIRLDLAEGWDSRVTMLDTNKGYHALQKEISVMKAGGIATMYGGDTYHNAIVRDKQQAVDRVFNKVHGDEFLSIALDTGEGRDIGTQILRNELCELSDEQLIKLDVSKLDPGLAGDISDFLRTRKTIGLTEQKNRIKILSGRIRITVQNTEFSQLQSAASILRKPIPSGLLKQRLGERVRRMNDQNTKNFALALDAHDRRKELLAMKPDELRQLCMKRQEEELAHADNNIGRLAQYQPLLSISERKREVDTFIEQLNIRREAYAKKKE